MSEKWTTWFGWLTLAAVLGALWLLFGEDPTKRAGARGELLFPAFGDQVALAHRISITGQDGKAGTTLVRDGSAWRVVERSGYEADTARVGRMLRGLVRSRLREPKTTNPDRFGAVGLGELALTLTVEDETGKVLAQLDLGRYRGVSNERSLTFIYKSGDSRAWVADALSEVRKDPAFWLRPGLVTLDEARIERVALGTSQLIRNSVGMFEFVDLAEGEDPQPDYILTEPGRVLAALDFADVRPVIPTANGEQRTDADFSLETYGGLTLSFRIVDRAGRWVRLAASYRDETLSVAEEDDLGSSAGGAAAEAARIIERTKGYEFKLQSSDFEALTRDRSYFVQPSSEASSDP